MDRGEYPTLGYGFRHAPPFDISGKVSVSNSIFRSTKITVLGLIRLMVDGLTEVRARLGARLLRTEVFGLGRGLADGGGGRAGDSG